MIDQLSLDTLADAIDAEYGIDTRQPLKETNAMITTTRWTFNVQQYHVMPDGRWVVGASHKTRNESPANWLTTQMISGAKYTVEDNGDGIFTGTYTDETGAHYVEFSPAN